MSLIPIFFLMIFSITSTRADIIDMQVSSGNIFKFLRTMANDTKGADSLNLPANATSIRQNIVDTFSCENRTYGYYADVENECQVFHVCLPSQTPSGRNVTYRWSFICPNETIFNQEVLVCTRPRDAIPCEESPMYFDLNMDLEKLPEDDSNKENKEDTKEETTSPASQVSRSKIKKLTKAPVRKQNLIVQNLLQEVVEEMDKVDDDLGNDGTDEIVPVIVDVDMKPEEIVPMVDVDMKPENSVPVIADVEKPGFEMPKVEDKPEADASSEVGGRILEERSLWNSRKLRRGFRFKADV